MKTIQEYTTEELQSILINTKAEILTAQETLQSHVNNRQVIEQELGKRAEEKPETGINQKNVHGDNVVNGVKKPKKSKK